MDGRWVWVFGVAVWSVVLLYIGFGEIMMQLTLGGVGVTEAAGLKHFFFFLT